MAGDSVQPILHHTCDGNACEYRSGVYTLLPPSVKNLWVVAALRSPGECTWEQTVTNAMCINTSESG